MLIVGASKSAAARREGQGQTGLPSQFRLGQADLRVDPVVTPSLQGLAVSGHF
jgi:hypothetical protein